jgi:hypothetical protein
LLKKLDLVGRDLSEYSLETVRMFYDDASKSGFSLNQPLHMEQSALMPSA